MKLLKSSVPRPGHTPPVPVWSKWDEFREILPEDDGKISPVLQGSVVMRGIDTTQSAMFSYVSPEQRTEGPSVEIDPSFV